MQKRQQAAKANHLLHEKSPYLQQHAYNPVNWYPWGDEALEMAVKMDRPIFLSIGYSTCHWCHVMAHESFEDIEIAKFLNKYFVCIKVDREERPGIDQLYMEATQAMTGGGGWPMSVFLFPDTRPFYAGTYFPPRAAYGRPGFLEILQAVQKEWQTNRQRLTLSADRVTAHLQRDTSVAGPLIDASWLAKGYAQIEDNYEPKYGGFGDGQKFPRPVVIDFLLRYYTNHGQKEARDMALFTLDQMAAGGMYDHLGGGFHRYSVDARWRIPHFEKMLYDQSQLASVYLSAYQLNGEERYKEIAVEILDYVLRDMQDVDGGFYSAEDADSVNPYSPDEHSEGAFYLWTAQEIDTLLSKREAAVFKLRYGVEEKGNALHDPQQEFTGRNILYQEHDLTEVARKEQLSEEKVLLLLRTGREKLLTIRNERTRPHRDDKIITAWNGLMISALAQAAMVLEEDKYLQAADRAADFILRNLVVNTKLKRRYREGEAKYPAGLDDYSFLIQGLLDLYTASHDVSRLAQALELTEQQITECANPAGGFFDTPVSVKLLARLKEAYDGAEPSGNSVAALNFMRLARLTNNKKWADTAEKTIGSFSDTLASYAPAMPLMLSALDIQTAKAKQMIVIAGNKRNDDTRALLKEVHSRYLPNAILMVVDGGANQKFLEKNMPFLQTVKKINGQATAYVCENFTCKMPVNTTADFARLLE